MISSAQFERVKYVCPKQFGKGETISYVTGLDTEALDTGKPFLCCLSTGMHFDPCQFPAILFKTESYYNCHYVVYNLKYDSGALLYHLPPEVKIELWEKTFTIWRDPESKIKFRFEYIPHKALFVFHKKLFIKIWDISQYYSMSLDNAAKRYLNKRKEDIETKTFTLEFVKKHFTRIVKYCVKDATLTAELGNFALTKLSEFGIRATALYSSASLSYRYFADRCRIVNSWRFWKYYPQVLKYAMDAYEGGKFEITARGSFYGYEYDIVSAYPCEIANLLDISLCKVETSNKYCPDAPYGFLRCRIDNRQGKHVPCGIMIKNIKVYPAGVFFVTITKQEYEYMTSQNIDITILSAVWLYVKYERKPYADIVAQLFALKSKYKGNDAMLYEVSKRMLNSFYGKTCQMIENYKQEVVAGIGWNPMYAAIITANTRIKVTRMQQLLGKTCLAVHTDSLITNKPLDPTLISNDLGCFDFQEKGDTILVACGQYEIGGKAAFKGFEPTKITRDGLETYESWKDILSRNLTKSQFTYPVLSVQSWIDAAAKGDFSKVNYFEFKSKQIDLNVDRKRNWLRNVVSRDLLESLDYSLPVILSQTEVPQHWFN